MVQQLQLPASATHYDTIDLSGGLDLLTPSLKLRSGYVRDALNWESSITGGYTRIIGYERYDGHLAAPSLATYQALTCVMVATVTAGQTITGATSGATGTVLSVTVITGGFSVIAYTQATGTFVAAENITVAAVVKGNVSIVGGAGPAADYDATQTSLAANVYRAFIAAVPGSGPVRGVVQLAGITYAWRNNAGGTALILWKATSAGWVVVPLLFEVAFTAGNLQYIVGATLTQGGVNATIKAVALQSGAWGGTGVGRLIISAPTGGNFAAGAAVGGGSATLSGIQTQIALSPGGFVQTDFGNFGAGRRVYGVDGVNRGFEFDGTTLVPISTGNSPDAPSTVLVHKDHLWFAFGDNYQNSGITTPFTWTALSGSAAYRADNTVTCFLRMSGDQSSGAMSISTLTSTFMMYGSSALDFKPVPFEESAGAHKFSGQRIGGQSMVLADLGVFSLSATQAFGNFASSSMTLKIRPFTQTRRNLLTATVINREKSQYRLFYSDGYGLYMTVANGKLVGSMPVNFPNDVTCACQGDTPDANETSFFGSSNGFVYRLDAGTSFDGAPIMSSFTLPYAFQGNSRIFKAWRGVSWEVQGDGYASFDVTYDMNYSNADREQGATPQSLPLSLAPGFWDAGTWDTFTWDGHSLGPTEAEMHGTGINVALRVDCSSDKFRSFTLNSAIVSYLVRKAMKK